MYHISNNYKRGASINDNGGFKEKNTINALLSTKLIIFLNYDEIGNWVYYIGAEGVVYIGYVVVVVKREYILQAKYS